MSIWTVSESDIEFPFKFSRIRKELRDRQIMENQVAEIFSQKLHVDVPSRDSDLFESGVLDSLQLVELLLQLELQFKVRISLDELDLENFRSIERITVMLVRRNGHQFRI